MKLSQDDFNIIYILSMFISGIILIILGVTLYKSDLILYMGLGLLSASMSISIIEYLMNRK